MAALRFVGGPVDGFESDLGEPVQERLRLTWPEALGGRGRALYELFVDPERAFYYFAGWEGDEDDVADSAAAA